MKTTRYFDQIKINHFEDTDTLHIGFAENAVVETRAVSANVYIDLDEDGHLISMTIEHAEENANIMEFVKPYSGQEIDTT